MPRSTGSLNATTLEKIRLYLEGDTSINIPKKVWDTYNANYVKKPADPKELQDAVEMTVVPEETAKPAGGHSPPQIANPADDVIPDDNTPPWEEPQTCVPAPTLGVSEDFGEQGDENHEDAFLAALNEQVAAGGEIDNTPPPAVPKPKKTAAAPKAAKEEKPVPLQPLKVGNIHVAETINVEEKEIPKASDPKTVRYGDPGWTQYILDDLTPGTEMVSGKDKQLRPKCMGLRRMVEKHIGPIMSTDMHIVATPNRENCGAWAIQAKVKVFVKNSDHQAYESAIEWTDIANAWANRDDQSDIVTRNPVASAYTAALSRCFRSILGLSGVYTSEEMAQEGAPKKYHNPDQPSLQNTTGPITDKLINIIEAGCKRYKADVMAVVRDVCEDVSIDSIHNLSAQEGMKIASVVNAFQHQEVPAKWQVKSSQLPQA